MKRPVLRYGAVRALVTLALWIILPLQMEAAKPPRSLKLDVQATAVRIEKAAAHGRVVLVGHEVADFGGAPVYRRVFRERDADESGAVVFDLGREVAGVSLWVAFDVQSGGYGASTKSQKNVREAELPARYFKKKGNAARKHLEIPLEYVYTLIVRPGVGVWEAVAGDGAEGDEDGLLNGRIEVPASRLRSRKTRTTDLDAYQRGDVVAVFAPREMAYLIVEVHE